MDRHASIDFAGLLSLRVLEAFVDLDVDSDAGVVQTLRPQITPLGPRRSATAHGGDDSNSHLSHLKISSQFGRM